MQNKVVLITGGTGSFGKAFCKELLRKDVRQVRIFSRDELKQAQMAAEVNDPRVEYLCGDIRDTERLNTALEGVNIVIHAAAMKRIEKCERDPQEALKTNIIGTMNVANSCLKNNVEKAVFISTDKAVYPVNLYGATKLAAEKIWTQSNTYRGTGHPTRFSTVRYGNVFGSRGSVIHLFKDQLEKGCLRVTDERMTRFFVTLQQAVDLVQYTAETMQGGEIFIPNIKAISIMHLAQMVAGKMPIEVTSQRGGEKLHESLVTTEESVRMASFDNFHVINPEIRTWPYELWVSGEVVFYPSSETAPKFDDAELKKLISSAI